MTCQSFDQRWESSVYAAGRQHNRWPDDSFIGAFFGLFARSPDRKAVKILEIGCGVGNNLWFFAREGFTAFGVDGSETAVRVAKQRMAVEEWSADVRIGDFTQLEFADEVFDFVLDRGSMTHNRRAGIEAATKEVARVLKPGGWFFSQMLSDDFSDRALGQANRDGSYDNFSSGYFASIGTTFFASPDDMRGFLDDRFVLKTLSRETHVDQINQNVTGLINVLAQKKVV